jgi:hypothetical protein
MLEELTIRKAVELAARTEALGTVFYYKPSDIYKGEYHASQ